MTKNRLPLNKVEWKEFKISDVFLIKDGYYNKKPPRTYINETIPFLGATAFNNGITEFYDENVINNWDKLGNQNNNDLHKRYFEGNCLVIVNNGSVGNVYYQSHRFTCSHDITPIYLKHYELNKEIGMFLALCLKRTGAAFTYARKWRPKRIRKSKIFLPIDNKNEPDYSYMEAYIKEKHNTLVSQLIDFYDIHSIGFEYKLKNLEEINWKEFWLEDVVTISSGVRLTNADKKTGKRPFVGASDSNNGITGFVKNINSSLDKNVLGVNYNGSVVENFYHPYECIFSDDVKRIHWKEEIQENKYTYLFLKQMILQQKVKYAYGYKFNAGRMKRQKILLPVNESGDPDYEYMHRYMQGIEVEQIREIINYYRNS